MQIKSPVQYEKHQSISLHLSKQNYFIKKKLSDIGFLHIFKFKRTSNQQSCATIILLSKVLLQEAFAREINQNVA